jgi:hypothetical protein
LPSCCSAAFDVELSGVLINAPFTEPQA